MHEHMTYVSIQIRKSGCDYNYHTRGLDKFWAADKSKSWAFLKSLFLGPLSLKKNICIQVNNFIINSSRVRMLNKDRHAKTNAKPENK
jgi:hypothetical protein